MTTTEASQQDDYDSPWKEAIEIMLADFMAFYFPDAWRAIDWQQPHRFLDQELQKIVPESGTGRRVVATNGSICTSRSKAAVNPTSPNA